MDYIKDIFKFELKLLKLTGLSFNEEESKLFMIYSVFVRTVFGYGAVVLQLSEVYKHLDDLDAVSHMTVHIFEHILGLIRITLIALNRKKLKNYLEVIRENYVTLSNGKDNLSNQYSIIQGTKTSRRQHENKKDSDNFIWKKNVSWNQLQIKTKEVVQCHITILEKVQEFESVFSGSLLLVFGLTILILCFLMYNASKLTHDDYSWLTYSIFVFGMSFEIFIYCYWGNEVTRQSKALVDACTEVDFVGYDVRFQKCLLIIMCRGQAPVQLTAGKIANLSLVAFVGIMRTSYSYFMVLKSVQ